MIGYTCKYTPIELLAAYGASPQLLNSETEDFNYSQEVSHINLCCHVKALLENVHKNHIKELVLVNCCDSVRRAYDILSRENMDFLFLMDLPHDDNQCARVHLQNELLRLCEEYSAYSGKTFDFDSFAAAFEDEKEAPQGDFIGILGARVSDGLLKQIEEQVPFEVRDYTCNSNRNLEKPEKQEFHSLMLWYASKLLSQIPCMRMADVARRREMFENPGLKGIIYHTVKFCDYYGFEYETIRKETKLPLVKIETDFTLQSLGQLSTRIGGFVESLGRKGKDIKVREGKYFAGIDSGSTTTNVAVIDREGNLVDSAIVRTGAKAQRGAEKAFDALKVPREEIALIVATGYGRSNISFADEAITEITCHARGAFQLDKSIRTIIDIGGQDSKAIALDENGNVKNFAMNDKCAAGTGRFLENMAKVLEIDLDGMSVTGLDWQEDLTISSMCTVFAESEVVSLIADNKTVADIVHGLNKSVAAKTMTLVKRVGSESRFMMTGGGARNKGVVSCIEDLLGEKLIVPDTPDLCGALGAALFALDYDKK